jgi:hypothetical protein
MENLIRIKPHHFIDIVTAYGDGRDAPEPHPLGHAVHLVTARVLENRDILLEMELGADDICQPCTKNADGLCQDSIDTSFRPEAPSSKREWNLIIDRRWCERLEIAQDDRMTARDFCLRLRERADDITDIYREIPTHMTADRQRKMEIGVQKFLED